MAVGDIYEIILKGACAGQAIYQVWHMQDALGTGDLVDLKDHLEDTGNPSTFSILQDISRIACSDWSIDSFLATKIFPLPKGPQIEQALDNEVVGTLSSASSLAATAVIKWVTAVGGRSGRGRTYFPPPGFDSYVDGLVSGTMVTRMNALVTDMLDLFNTAGAGYDGSWIFGIWSKLNEEFNMVTGGIPRDALKTQRRRQLGVGI
jgi:hypothetical protein